MDVKSECAWELIMEGASEDVVKEWCNAIFLHPDLSQVGKKLAQDILVISDGDLMGLLTIYGEEGSEAALKAMVGYFSKLYGIGRALPIIENNSVKIMACDTAVRHREMQMSGICVNPIVYECDGAAILVLAAHEVWHAWQVDMAIRWLASLGKAEINFSVNPYKARQELLYYLNCLIYVDIDAPRELYYSQLIEQEAYCATYAMIERLGMFSPKVLNRAIRSLKAIGACAG